MMNLYGFLAIIFAVAVMVISLLPKDPNAAIYQNPTCSVSPLGALVFRVTRRL